MKVILEGHDQNLSPGVLYYSYYRGYPRLFEIINKTETIGVKWTWRGHWYGIYWYKPIKYLLDWIMDFDDGFFRLDPTQIGWKVYFRYGIFSDSWLRNLEKTDDSNDN